MALRFYSDSTQSAVSITNAWSKKILDRFVSLSHRYVTIAIRGRVLNKRVEPDPTAQKHDLLTGVTSGVLAEGTALLLVLDLVSISVKSSR